MTKPLNWQHKAKKQRVKFQTLVFCLVRKTLMLCCQTHISFCCPLMVSSLLVLPSSSAVHRLRFTAGFPNGLADNLCKMNWKEGGREGCGCLLKSTQMRSKIRGWVKQVLFFLSCNVPVKLCMYRRQEPSSQWRGNFGTHEETHFWQEVNACWQRVPSNNEGCRKYPEWLNGARWPLSRNDNI